MSRAGAGRSRAEAVPLAAIAREWFRIGCIGFGGPPAHIALLRKTCVEERGWITSRYFEDGLASANLLPGPASTQLSILCAWWLRGAAGALIGGICFIAPGLVLILGLSVLFLAGSPPEWVLGAAAGAGAAVAAVALHAAIGLMPASWRRTGSRRSQRARWIAYAILGGVAAATIGPYLVLVLLVCGLGEAMVRTRHEPTTRPGSGPAGLSIPPALLGVAAVAGGLGALVWVAFKVGALSYGGGFVIVPLMQADAVGRYHWMTGAQFLNGVALGQVTPGPVTLTVAVVGYAAAGVGGALLATAVAFAPSFAFVLFGGPHFGRLREIAGVQGFLAGAGPAAIGAIVGAAIPLGLAIDHLWQVGVLAGALVWLVGFRRSVVLGLLAAGAIGVIAALAGAPIGR